MESIHTSLREYLPAEMRLLSGAVGLVGGGLSEVADFARVGRHVVSPGSRTA